jgi:hypothetical protein
MLPPQEKEGEEGLPRKKRYSTNAHHAKRLPGEILTPTLPLHAPGSILPSSQHHITVSGSRADSHF